MKIYEITYNKGEKDYVSANTIIEALQEYTSSTFVSLDEMDKTDDIVEIPESEWEERRISFSKDEFNEDDIESDSLMIEQDELNYYVTFKEWIKTHNYAAIICGDCNGS
jgi:hypothetical protein